MSLWAYRVSRSALEMSHVSRWFAFMMKNNRRVSEEFRFVCKECTSSWKWVCPIVSVSLCWAEETPALSLILRWRGLAIDRVAFISGSAHGLPKAWWELSSNRNLFKLQIITMEVLTKSRERCGLYSLFCAKMLSGLYWEIKCGSFKGFSYSTLLFSPSRT